MKIKLQEPSLVLLMGASGSGKSTFARKHFKPTEIISSDYCRGLVSDDENDQSCSQEAFEVLDYIVNKRLKRGKLTVIDATNVQKEARRPLIKLARDHDLFISVIVLKLPVKTCQERNRSRPDRQFGPHVIRNQFNQLKQSLSELHKEKIRNVHVLETLEDVEQAEIIREPLWNNLKHVHGPFDFIGDVHGCALELESLLHQLGYQLQNVSANWHPAWGNNVYIHPAGRKAVFVGDLVDRGPRSVDCLKIVHNMVVQGSALCVPGNHDAKLLRKLLGNPVKVGHGLQITLDDIESLGPEIQKEFEPELIKFLDSLISHYVLDDGKLVVAHAGLKEAYQGRSSSRVRDFALFGEVTGDVDEAGLPERLNWANDYRGSALVVYGHTPTAEPLWQNHTLNIDTGCVFGGKLTAYRYPENSFVSIPAEKTYYETSRPFLPHDPRIQETLKQQSIDDVLDAADVTGKRVVSTALLGNVTIREENSIAAWEVMSRFAVDPKWLIYLPPTMSPSETSTKEDYLEHPREALQYYSSQGINHVLCEQKHMGSRAVVIICKDSDTAAQRFGITTGESGIVYTRTGRRFFNDLELEQQFISRIQEGLTAGNFWQKMESDWICLDGELMPWSMKAQALLQSQYAAVGAAGKSAIKSVNQSLTNFIERMKTSGIIPDHVQSLQEKFSRRSLVMDKFIKSYREYCWPVNSLQDLQFATFHIMATEGKVHTDRTHLWHMEQAAKLCEMVPGLLIITPYLSLDLTKAEDVTRGIDWWLELTENGGEGMVIKPVNIIEQQIKKEDQLYQIQPAIKCRGREYLRIIYGPNYTEPDQLTRLKFRHLGRKRSLALREFSLGIESLTRFIKRESLRRVHECVFGVLAMESESVDPRL